MKILEVRDGFIKFEKDDSIFLSSFIKISGIAKSYIAQVFRLKGNIALAKILFLYDGELQPYDKTLPSEDSEIEDVTLDILNNSIKADNPVIAGKGMQGINIITDAAAFDKKMLISIDDRQENNILVRNLVRQFNNLGKNVVIIDTLGIIDANKAVAGVDFKLPLDTESLAFMYQDCLNDATAESKSLIIEIFKDLSDYSKTVPFLPFGALKTIVDDMVDKQHVFKLLVLKNKLAKFDKLGYFAKDKNEVDKLNALLDLKCSIIDLSKLDNTFQNRYLAFLYEKLQEKNNTQVFLELSNIVNKKNLKSILSEENSVPTTFVTHSRFKYINDIKNLFDNFIVAPSIANNEIFKIYSTFLNAMPKSSYLIAGEAVNYIPLVSKLQIIEEVPLLEEHLETEEPAEVEEIAAEPVLEEEETEVPEVVTEEVENEDIVEEETITNEEIIANIDEKSNEAISEVISDITPVSAAGMFDNEDEEPVSEEEVAEEETEEIEENDEEVLEEEVLEPEIIEDEPEDEVVEDLDISELEEDVPEEIEETEELDVSDLEEDAHENIEEVEELDVSDLEDSTEEESDFIDEEYEELDISSDDEENEIEISDDIDLELDSEPELLEEKPEDEKIYELPDIEPDKIQFQPLNEDYSEFDEIVELNLDEVDENDIVIDMEEEDNLPLDDEQIVQEVDKVFTTRKDDDISDSDLDFIDELNSDEELQEDLEELSDGEEGILEEPQEQIELDDDGDNEILETRNSSTPIVPVYEADIPEEDMVTSDPIEQGDTVTHAKYGNGVVEKMIKYGNKTLFSINFDNVGRRLLDPTLTEIKKS